MSARKIPRAASPVISHNPSVLVQYIRNAGIGSRYRLFASAGSVAGQKIQGASHVPNIACKLTDAGTRSRDFTLRSSIEGIEMRHFPCRGGQHDCCANPSDRKVQRLEHGLRVFCADRSGEANSRW
jgi:hypothetical protein